jgi:hypothetical protein
VLSLSGTNQNVACNGNVNANNFSSSSDAKLKDDQQVAPTAAAASILAAVSEKTYSRNDLDGQKRVGFIAQEIQAACSGNWAHIVSSSPDVDVGAETGTSTLQIDYSRITTVLWSVCQDLTARVAALEAQR